MARKQERPLPSADDLLRRLEIRYGNASPPQTPEWAIFREVRVPRPDSRYRFRSADALAVGLWPSTRYQIHGFEIKVSRSDWLQELREPNKAEDVARYCNYWWLVVADPAIVRDDLPAGWGLLVPSGTNRLRTLQKPTFREAVTDPDFTAQLMSKALLQHRVCRGHGFHNGYWKGYEKGQQDGDRRIEQLMRYREEVRRAS